VILVLHCVFAEALQASRQARDGFFNLASGNCMAVLQNPELLRLCLEKIYCIMPHQQVLEAFMNKMDINGKRQHKARMLESIMITGNGTPEIDLGDADPSKIREAAAQVFQAAKGDDAAVLRATRDKMFSKMLGTAGGRGSTVKTRGGRGRGAAGRGRGRGRGKDKTSGGGGGSRSSAGKKKAKRKEMDDDDGTEDTAETDADLIYEGMAIEIQTNQLNDEDDNDEDEYWYNGKIEEIHSGVVVAWICDDTDPKAGLVPSIDLDSISWNPLNKKEKEERDRMLRKNKKQKQ
jgi:hypothetical protein